MEIVSNGPLTASSVAWQPAPRTFALTVVARGTFQIVPHELILATQQDAPHAEDTHWNDDPTRSLSAAGDLVPFKVRADVVAVGNVFAPRREPARSVMVRLKVGEIDKAVEVFVDARGQLVLPVGFGPVSPTWPARRDLLGRHAATWQPARWMDQPLPTDFDPAFFNVAPRDQQIEGLRDDEPILLEGLHPEHPRLATALPGVRPRARVERRGGSEEIAMRADTLWIDTARGICAVTWRGRVMLDQPGEPGRVIVETDTSKKRGADSAPRPPAARPSAQGSAAIWETMAMDGALSELRDAAEAARAALPFAPSAAPAAPPAPAFAPPPAFVPPPAFGAAPAAPAFAPAPAYPPAPPVPSYVAPAPAYTPPVPVAPAPAYSPSPPVMFRPSPAPPIEPSPEAASEPHDAPPEAPPARQKSAARDIVKLVWFDPASPARVRKHLPWRKIMVDLELKLVIEEEDDLAAGPMPPEVKDRRAIQEALIRADSIAADGVKQAVESAVGDDGAFDPPLAVLDAELELPFDELATLKTTAALARPLATGDKRLTETLDLVDQLLGTPTLHGAAGMAESLTGKVREAFTGTKRAVAPDYLDAHGERMLLEQRAYQRRALFDRKWIRALMRGAQSPIPVYLPEDLKDGLPMFRRFRARFLAELDMREDQGEASPWAVRVLALGRVIAPPT